MLESSEIEYLESPKSTASTRAYLVEDFIQKIVPIMLELTVDNQCITAFICIELSYISAGHRNLSVLPASTENDFLFKYRINRRFFRGDISFFRLVL